MSAFRPAMMEHESAAEEASSIARDCMDEWWGEEKARARARVCVRAPLVTTILLLSRTFGWRGEEKVCLCVRAPLLVTTILLLEEEEGIF